MPRVKDIYTVGAYNIGVIVFREIDKFCFLDNDTILQNAFRTNAFFTFSRQHASFPRVFFFFLI